MTSASKSPASDAYPVVHLLRQLSPSLVHDAAETISAHIPVQPALRVISRLASNLASPTVIGANDQGTRKVIPLTTGRLSISGVDGRDGPEAFDGAICLEGGTDYMTVNALGDACLDARYSWRLVSGRE